MNEIQTRINKNEEVFLSKLEDIFREGMNRGVIHKTRIAGMIAAYYSFRQGCLAFANFYLLNGEFDKQKLIARIKTTWDNYWLGIKEHHPQDLDNAREGVQDAVRGHAGCQPVVWFPASSFLEFNYLREAEHERV